MERIKDFTIDADQELTAEKLSDFINLHMSKHRRRYKRLKEAYETRYEIFRQEDKPEWKPDNRIAVNFAKYITDTMNGFFIGNAIKITSDDKNVADYVDLFSKYNDQDDKNAELSKMCSIFGRGHEMYLIDEQAEINTVLVSPMDSFFIFDDSVLKRPLYFVRYYKKEDLEQNIDVLKGEVYDSTNIKVFRLEGEIVFEDEEAHGFDGVPAVEFVENQEKIGIFEPVLSMINAYNKAISEKANDVDYFADAYLKVLGTYLDDNDTKHIRDNRIINFDGEASELDVDFLSKPNGDVTQENLLDRLERLIYQISMVANISDENFGVSSGIALKYKLLSMIDLAKTKERKFISGMNRRYKTIFSSPLNTIGADDWVKLNYQFTYNIPANVLEETQIASTLEGIVSKETQLKALSIVDNVDAEIERMEKEDQDSKESITNALFGGDTHGEQ